MINRNQDLRKMVSKEFIDAYFDVLRERGVEALERVRTDYPDEYEEILDELSRCRHPAVFAVLRAHLREY